MSAHRGNGNNKPKAAPSKNSNKSEKVTDKGKQKLFCKYCKATDHIIKDCPRVKAKEAKKREEGMAVAEAPTSGTNGDSANVA